MNLFDEIMGIESNDSVVIESSDKSTLDTNFKKKSGIEFDIVDIDDKKAKGKIDTIKGKYKNNFVGFVAFEKGTDKLAGFIRVWPNWITKDWHGNLISPIEVKPKYRGYGLGKLLMEKAIKKYNANYLFVNEDNEIAIKLYKSLGFRISDTLSHEEGDEDGDGEYYLMTLPSARKEVTTESAYDRPFSYDEIVRNYGKSKADELMKDDAHKFRADSGIELIHKEPTKEELLRIWKNWNNMNPKDKAISDKKSMELYGLTNAENFNKLKNEYNTYSGPVLYHGSKEDLINIEARNLSFNERDFIFASNDRNYALCFAGNRWNDSMLNLSYYDGQMYLTELKYGMLKTIYDTDGFIYELPSTSFKPYKTKKNEFVSISKSITPVRRVYIKNILNELRNSGVIISYYPKKPKWWIDNVNESSNSIFTESWKSKITDNFKPKGKKSLSDFNMVKIDKAFIDKYKSDYSSLKHVDLKDDAYAWIDKENNKLVAIAAVDLSDHGDENKWITVIEVFDNYKGYGLGKQLLDYCVKHLKGDALGVYKDNQVAIEMYKKYGFKISKESQEEIDSGKTKWYKMYLKLNTTNESYYELFESIITDRKDIYHNRDKFESGEINLCFITGHSGSGKSTIGKSLSSKDKTEYFELDDVVANYNFSDENLKEYGDLIYSFFKSSGKPYRFTSRKEFEDTDFKDRYKDYDIKITKAFIDHSIKYAKSHTSNKYVVEGVEIFWCIEPKYVEDYAVYIKGTSALKSMHRAAKRDQDPGILGYLDLFLDLNRLKTYRIYEKDLNKWYSYYSKLDKEEVVTEKFNYIIEDIYGIEKDNEWNAIVKVKGIDKPLRGRSEILIIKDDKVFLCFDRPTSIDKKYRLPGGGWNKDEDHMKSAIREAEEEAKIKTKNIMYYDTYIDVYDTPKRWVEERIPEKYWWYGYYTDVYVGEYDGKYTGYVNIQDRDSDMVKDGDFYDIKEVWDVLNDFHKEAIEKYKESQIKIESSNIIKERADILDKIRKALQSGLGMNDSQAKKLISEDSYDQFVHGKCDKGRIGDENCICIAGLNKDNFNKAYVIVKDTIDGTDFTVNKDNYCTLFLTDKNKVDNESYIEDTYKEDEIMSENTFDKLYYGLDDVFIEATGKAETTIIREQIYPIVEKVLSDPNGDRKFRLLVKKFLDKNASKLNTAGPTYMIPFTDDDKEEFFKCFGTSKNDLVKPIVKMTNLVNDKAGWKSLRQNPIFCLFYCCIRYYTIKKDEKGLNTALIIYALSVYPSRYSVFFQYGANPDIMDYTIDNLSARFLFKKEGSVLATLLSSIKNSYEFHKKDFPEGTDDSVISWVSRIRNDQNSLLKNIASEYYINHRKNARIVTQSETYSDNEMIDDNLNDTSVVEDVTRRISVNIITNGVDITRATAAAKLAGISVSDLRFYLQKIITKERNEELNKFIESVVFIYLYKENHKPYEINEMKFLQFGSDLFRRTNTNDPNVVTIKELLNVWSSQSGINDKYKRIASQINYKRGIFMYIILCIQYYNQK